uniref:Reverse transcriptase n=1 Tax=Globodera pallida TaxID=36090 RepID=A0A183C8N0_GLOPA
MASKIRTFFARKYYEEILCTIKGAPGMDCYTEFDESRRAAEKLFCGSSTGHADDMAVAHPIAEQLVRSSKRWVRGRQTPARLNRMKWKTEKAAYNEARKLFLKNEELVKKVALELRWRWKLYRRMHR